MKYFLSFTLLITVILFPSCGKKWKKPTHVSCFFLLSTSNPGLANISSGSMVISEIDFNGKRKQGTTSVSFVKTYDNGLLIPLSTSKSVSDLLFDIPQGTYTEMNFKIKLKDFNNNPSITLKGTYTNTLSATVPLLFNLDADENIEISSKSSNGNSEIVLIESKPAQVNLNLNPNYWFQAVPQIMFEDGDLTEIEGIMTMVINKDNNQDIYNLIVNRIKDGNDAVFQ